MAGSSLWLWLTLGIAGTAANEIWRVAGVLLSRGVDPESPLMMWVKDVSTALVAALIARLLLEPTGALAGVAAAVRLTAFGTGIVVYVAGRRNLALSLASAEAAFLGLHWLLKASA